MPLVTLIGEKIAKEGTEFVYIGPNNDCRNCKLKTVCFNLKIGRNYRITKIRDKRHNCNVHEGTTLVVEVEELPIIAAIDQDLIDKKETKIEKKECQNIGCEYYQFCNNVAIQKERNYKIIKVLEKIDCPIGYELNKVELND